MADNYLNTKMLQNVPDLDSFSLANNSQTDNKSSVSNQTNFMEVNKAKASQKTYLNRRNLACDRLNPQEKERLDELMDQIDGNLDDIQKEKKQAETSAFNIDQTSQALTNKYFSDVLTEKAFSGDA